MRDQQLLDYSKGVKERIEPLIDSLTQYGVSKELVDEFYTNINTFEGLINEPRELINTRKTINEIIEDKIAKASELLTTTIDGLMELFNDQVPFYLEYKSARNMVNPAVRHRNTPEEETAEDSQEA